MMALMVPVVLSIGAIYALVPLMIIVALIAAAAGLSRGANIFQFFGFDALLGLSSGVGAGGSGKGMVSKSLKYSTDQQEKLLEAMRSATKKPRGVTRREINIGRKGITISATAKQKEQSITAKKGLMERAGAPKADRANIEAKTTRDVKKLMSEYRGKTTLVGRAIPDWMATRSRRIEKVKYTGPDIKYSKDAVGSSNAAMRQAWNEETESLSKRIRESKRIRDEAKEKEAEQKKINAQATQKALADDSTFGGRMARQEARLAGSRFKGAAEALGVSGALPAAVFGYHGIKAIWDEKARKEIIAAYSQNPELPTPPPNTENSGLAAAGGGSDWDDFAKRAIKATAKSYEAFFVGETLSRFDIKEEKSWLKSYAASRYNYEEQPKPESKAPVADGSESAAE